MKLYRKLVARAQMKIVGVTQAEKLEEAKERFKQETILGYDPEKWVKAEANIRDEEHLDLEYH